MKNDRTTERPWRPNDYPAPRPITEPMLGGHFSTPMGPCYAMQEPEIANTLDALRQRAAETLRVPAEQLGAASDLNRAHAITCAQAWYARLMRPL